MTVADVALSQQQAQDWFAKIDEWVHNRGSEALVLDVNSGGNPVNPSLFPLKAPQPKLIGLSGRARSGKDTVANILHDAFKVERIAFAEPIRESLRAMMGLTDEHFHGALKEVEIPWLGKSPRQLMQTLGTEWGRGLINDKIWLLIAKQKIIECNDNMRHVVVTDVRFENEASFIRENGGVVWHIIRDSAVKVAAHASEAGIAFRPDLGDIRIDNNGTLDDLSDDAIDNF